MDEKTTNIKNNLDVQVNKIFQNTNERGYATRARYEDACERFSGFLADEFRLQKFANVKEKHITRYAEKMKTEGKSASTMKTDLAGIRFAYERSGGKNVLPGNEKLNLPQRSIGKVDRAWTPTEIQTAKNWAKIQGRPDVYHAVNLSSRFGFRIEGVCRATVSHVKNALETKELYIREKGGLTRVVPVTKESQVSALQEVLAYAKAEGKTGQEKILSDPVKGGVQKQIKSLQNWITNNQKYFLDNSIRGQKALQEFKQKIEGAGLKVRSESLSFHGLRYRYAQERYTELRERYDDQTAKKITSENMGHHRAEVTNIYLS